MNPMDQSARWIEKQEHGQNCLDMDADMDDQ
jgi:hypothetical protein